MYSKYNYMYMSIIYKVVDHRYNCSILNAIYIFFHNLLFDNLYHYGFLKFLKRDLPVFKNIIDGCMTFILVLR